MHKLLFPGHRPLVIGSRPASNPNVLPGLVVVALLLGWTSLATGRLVGQEGTQAASSVAPTTGQTVDLSDEVVHDVLAPFQTAIETRNLDNLLSTFDREHTVNYGQIREQFVTFFQLHDNIRFRYQLQQATAEKDIAYAIADVELDAQPADILPTEQRRTAQMRFQMLRTPKGWRLTAVKPMDFFTQ